MYNKFCWLSKPNDAKKSSSFVSYNLSIDQQFQEKIESYIGHSKLNQISQIDQQVVYYSSFIAIFPQKIEE